MEIMKWVIYCLLCFAPWLKPKNSFGMTVKIYLYKYTLYFTSVDEVLGLKTTREHVQNCIEQSKKMNNVFKANDDNLDVEFKHATEVSTLITDSIPDNTRKVASTTINLSLVQEVTILKQDNEANERANDKAVNKM